MQARVRVMLSALALGLLTAIPAAAQHPPFLHIPERASVGLAFGRSSNADPNGGHAGEDWGLTFEAPMAQPRRLRVDVGQARWRFDAEGANDKATVSRATVTIIHVTNPPQPGFRLGMYGGFGVGAYHYGFRSGRESGRLRLGAHALMGWEYVLRSERTAIVAEVRIGAAGSPGQNVPIASAVFSASWALGARLRF